MPGPLADGVGMPAAYTQHLQPSLGTWSYVWSVMNFDNISNLNVLKIMLCYFRNLCLVAKG